MYGKNHTEKVKLKISKALKKAWKNPDLVKHQSKIRTGVKLSEEHKRKIGIKSKALWENTVFRNKVIRKITGLKRTEEQKKRYSLASTNRVYTDKAKKNMSDSNWKKDHVQYSFIHKNGDEFFGTRADFKRKYKIDPAGLFRSSPKKQLSVKDWRLKENEGIILVNNNIDKKIYRLVNSDGRTFRGTRKQFHEDHGKKIDKLVCKNPRNHVDNWFLQKE